MKNLLYFVVLFSLVCSISNADTTKDELIEELYIKSGLENQIKDTPETLQQSINLQKEVKNRSKFMKEYLKNIDGFIEKSYDPSKMKIVIKSVLNEDLNENEIKTIISWLDTPVGIKCTKLEEYYSTPKAMAEFENYLTTLNNQPPSEERLQLIKDFESTLNQIDFTTDLTINMQVAIAISVAYSVPFENEIDISKIRKKIESLKPQIREILAPRIIALLLYTYQDLTNDELNQYINFAASEFGQKYHKATSRGYDKAFTQASLDLGEQIADFIKLYKSQAES